MKVARYDYRSQFERFDEFIAELSQMIANGHYVLSEEVKQFEAAFARYLGCSYIAGVNTGTDALTSALRVLELQPKDEVVTQANTFNATVTAICLAGVTPVLVDADEETFLMNRDQALATMCSKTRVVLPVHLYGKPTPMRELLRECEKQGIELVEDAAQAHGARIDGRRVGTLGVLGCFSFHPSKNLAAAGDGGAVATNRADLHDQLTLLRALGQRGQNEHVTLGCNSKLDAIQARVLSWKLSELDRWNEQRRSVARAYRARLLDVQVKFQAWDEQEEHVFHLFAIRTEQREKLQAHLQASGVDAVVRYPVPIHLQPVFSDRGWRKGQFPVAETLARELLCLPIRPNLTTDEIDYVCDCVRHFFDGRTMNREYSVGKTKGGL